MAGEFYRKATTRTRVKKLRIQEKTKPKTNQKMELGRKMGYRPMGSSITCCPMRYSSHARLSR